MRHKGTFAKRICRGCHEEYFPAGNNQKYCSASCREPEDKRNRNLSHRNSYLPRPKKTGICLGCGAEYQQTNGNQRWCLECRHLKINSRSYSHRFKKYGFTEELYKERSISQDGKCAVCGKSTKLVVDHDHLTGRVRGLLCRDCNLALGHVHDHPDILQKLIDYLQDIVHV